MSFDPQDFPKLARSGYSITSPETIDYNCIAWAAGDQSMVWAPIQSHYYYWPRRLRRSSDLSSFISLFRSLGFEICESGRKEKSYEKVAIYAEGGVFKHVARQLKSGKWTSKLGTLEDIEHAMQALEGREYGRIVTIMKRQV